MDKQFSALDDSMFDLAMLGMLELEGREMMKEEEELKKLFESQPSSQNKSKLEKILKHNEFKRSMATMARYIRPLVAGTAIIFATIFAGASLSLVVSADARELFYKMITRETPRYTEISGNSKFEGILYAPTYIPEGYKVSEVDNEGRGYTALIEKGETGRYVAIVCGSLTGNARLDTENADRIEQITINSSEALLVVKGERILINWQNQNYRFVVQTNDSVEEAIKIAESME